MSGADWPVLHRSATAIVIKAIDCDDNDKEAALKLMSSEECVFAELQGQKGIPTDNKFIVPVHAVYTESDHVPGPEPLLTYKGDIEFRHQTTLVSELQSWQAWIDRMLSSANKGSPDSNGSREEFHFVLVMPLGNLTLDEAIRHHRLVDDIPLIIKIMCDVAGALEYLHVQQNIVHADLKPSNIGCTG